jgi:beta-lactamase regulating signal transducer with metallopeptidase domain/protocatechuate 3,4-dioxygenase beta subunit
MRFDWTQTLTHLPPALDAIVKLTVLLALAWVLRPMLRQANPRWRVFFWRGVALSAALMLPAVLLAPAIRIPLLPPPASQPDALLGRSEAAPVLPRTEEPGPSQPDSIDPVEAELRPLPALEPGDQPRGFRWVPATARTTTPPSLRRWLREHLGSALFTAWLLPALGLAGGAMIAQRRTARRLRTAPSAPPAACHLLERIARDFGYGRSIWLCVSSDVRTPHLAGILRPAIVLPQRVLASGDSDLRGILAHELAHLTSWDLPWSRLIQALSICLWFHPLVWGIRREHLDACEQVSDAEAARYVGDASAYSGTLARIALGALGRRHVLAGIPMARRPEIQVRLEMLRQGIDTSPLRRPRVALTLCVGCLLLVGLGGLRLVDAGGTQQRGERADGSNEPPATTEQPPTTEEPETMVIGQVLDPSGKPVPQAQVAVIARSRRPARGGDLQGDDAKPLAETKTDDKGRFRVHVPPISSASFVHADVVAAKSGYGVGWEPLALGAEKHDVVVRLTEEQPVRGRVVDDQNRPAAGARIYVTWLGRTSLDTGVHEGVAPRFSEEQFPAWPEPVTTDDQGRFAIRGVNRQCTVKLNVSDDRFARWDFFVWPPGEKPPVRDAEYQERTRYLAKASEDVYCEDATQELTFSPPPAQIIEGQVLYADTKEPAAHARLTAYARQMELGSAVGIAGRADASGRFRLNPYPGKFFEVTAYPPNGQPYLTLQNRNVPWPEGAASQKVEMALPRGVLVRGKITEQPSGKPVEGASVQYYSHADNPHDREDVVTRWQGRVLSHADGTFEIAVPAGKGTLLVHGPTPDYVQQVIGSNQVRYGRPGGERYYVHASIPLDLQPGAGAHAVTASLQRGVTVRGRLLGPSGKTVEEAVMLTSLYISPLNVNYRALPLKVREGWFELPGCHPEKSTSVYFVDPKNRLGAVLEVSGRMAGRQPLEVRLAPCGTATARFIDPQGKPLSNLQPSLKLVMTPGPGGFRRILDLKDDRLWADEDSVANFDRLNYWWPGPRTNQQGRCTFPALIPGANYRLDVFDKAASKWVTKDFSVASGETLQLPEMVINQQE